MADILDTRRKALEEEYFQRQNEQALAKLRAKIAIAEQAKASGKSSMKCPRCDGTLAESKVEEVTIDSCDKCGGIWLDSGELEQLTKKESGWFSRLWSR